MFFESLPLSPKVNDLTNRSVFADFYRFEKLFEPIWPDRLQLCLPFWPSSQQNPMNESESANEGEK